MKPGSRGVESRTQPPRKPRAGRTYPEATDLDESDYREASAERDSLSGLPLGS